MDVIDYARFLLALLLVVGLILALAWGLKRYGIGQAGSGLLGKRRLVTVETTSVDARNKLVLVRRDDVEHLLLVGPGVSTVIETGIPGGARDTAKTETRQQAAQERIQP